MNWVKRHKTFCVCIGLLICVGIPSVINIIMSFNIIPSIGTENAEWLGFWGSFLGGIIGGLATLIGVLLTLKKMEKEENEKKRGEAPFLIPLRKDLTIYIDNKDKMHYFHNKFIKNNADELFKEYELININLINSGKNCALSIGGSWRAPEGEILQDYLSKHNIKNNFPKYFKSLNNKVYKCSNLNIQIIMPSESYLDECGIMSSEFTTYIAKLVECLVSERVSNNSTISFRNIPLGELVLDCDDVYGIKKIYKKYLMEMRLSGLTPQNEKKYSYYHLVIEFKLMNYENNI